MKNFKSTALAALLAGLTAQSIYAQGQSSGESTQRPKPPQAGGQSTNSAAQSPQPNKSAPPQNSGVAAPNANGSGQSQSSTNAQPQSAIVQQLQQPQQSQGAPQQNQNGAQHGTAKPENSPPQSTGSGKIAPDPFKSDTQSTGRISETSSGASAGSAQGSQSQEKSADAKKSDQPQPAEPKTESKDINAKEGGENP